jgi:3-methyladenine DNA glycosylase/8-oxoguanine DNA glycosylase
VQTTGAPNPATGAVPLPQRHTLAPLCNGRHDPTTRLGSAEFVRATLTPDGPGTVHLDWRTGTLAVRTWGPGGDWLRQRVPALVGALDTPVLFRDPPPALARAQRHHPELRLGAGGTLYHDLLPTILAQRITAGEAVRQWQRLCTELGDTAPGPFAGLRLPPAPDRLAGRPSWWFHPLGVERSRAETLVTVARRADHLWRWSGELGDDPLPVHELATRLAQLRGVGEWTIGIVLGTALGEPDAVAVGDYHLKNVVAWALAGEPRATDERMLELLEPFRGQRGRVVRLLLLDGHRAPSFGPRQRILPMHRW